MGDASGVRMHWWQGHQLALLGSKRRAVHSGFVRKLFLANGLSVIPRGRPEFPSRLPCHPGSPLVGEAEFGSMQANLELRATAMCRLRRAIKSIPPLSPFADGRKSFPSGGSWLMKC